MNHQWYSKEAQCPKCKSTGTLVHFVFSADGELKFQYICDKCVEGFEWHVFASALFLFAQDLDVESYIKAKLNGPVRPPFKLLPPISHELTDDDRKWEHDCGIDPEERGSE